MQPYQQASEEFSKQSVRPFEAAASIAALPLKASIASRAMSFLNKYIPADLASKGLNKIDPRLGKFISKGLEMGHSYDELKDYLGNKISETNKQSEEPAKQHRSIIEQYSPELYQFLKGEIRKGRSPSQAGALAQNDKKFLNIIKKISKDHKSDWSAIIESVFGMDQGQSAPLSREEALKRFNEKIRKPSLRDQEMERFQNAYGQQQPMQGQSQPGQGQAALMAILQKINQARGG